MLTKTEIKKMVPEIKKKLQVKVYTPTRYFTGLNTKGEVRQRIKTIVARLKQSKKGGDKKKYLSQFKTDKGKKTKTSSWTKKFYTKYGVKMKKIKAKYPKLNIFQRVAKATGLKRSVLKKSYNRGIDAYKSGHRVGATAQQWGYARMYSLIIRYKRSSLTHDKDLAKLLKK